MGTKLIPVGRCRKCRLTFAAVGWLPWRLDGWCTEECRDSSFYGWWFAHVRKLDEPPWEVETPKTQDPR